MIASLHRREGPDDANGNLGEVYDKVVEEIGGALPPALLKLAAILRVADGLDYQSHLPIDITDVRLQGTDLLIQGSGSGFSGSFQQAQRKSGLLTELLGVRIAPARPAAPTRMVIVDLLGTLVDHHARHAAVPGMDALLRRLAEAGWRLAITTSCDTKQAETLIRGARLPADIRVYKGNARPALVEQALAAAGPVDLAYYIDDSPKGIRGVAELGLPCLHDRILSFIGAGRHADAQGEPTFVAWCLAHNIRILPDAAGLETRIR